jgi:hypothetical protein
MPGKPNFLVRDQPALMDNCKCMCMWAGVIEIADAGQNFMSDGAEAGAGVAEQSAPAPVAAASGFQPTQLAGAAMPGGLASGFQPAGLQPNLPAGFQPAGGGFALQPNSIQPAGGGAQAPQGPPSATVPQSTLFVKKIEGAKETYPRQQIAYKVIEYNKDKIYMSTEERSKINETKWALKIGRGNITELADKKGEKIILDIKSEWENSDIFVTAYIENAGEASIVTKVLIDPYKGKLIRGVIGKDEALPGQEAKYEATGYNEDGDAGRVSSGNGINWAIKVGENGSINREMLKGEAGKRVINLEMKPDWAGKDIFIMPYLNSPTATVSVKTNVRISLGTKIKEMRSSNEAEHTYGYSDLFIEKLISYMKAKHLNTSWLEKVSNSSIELRRLSGGLATTDFSTVVINVGDEFFNDETRRKEEILQAIVLHELRHVWQKAEWAGNLLRRNRNDGRYYSNILMEVDAFDAQFSFEKKSGSEVDIDRINAIRSSFNTDTSEALRVKRLMEPIRLQDSNGNYYDYVYGINYYYYDADTGITTYARRSADGTRAIYDHEDANGNITPTSTFN